MGKSDRSENRLYGFKIDFVGGYDDGNSVLESRTEIWKTGRLQNRLYDFKKDFSGCTRLRIRPTGIGKSDRSENRL